jgi:hypothetical protein
MTPGLGNFQNVQLPCWYRALFCDAISGFERATAPGPSG